MVRTSDTSALTLLMGEIYREVLEECERVPQEQRWKFNVRLSAIHRVQCDLMVSCRTAREYVDLVRAVRQDSSLSLEQPAWSYLSPLIYPPRSA